MGNCFNSDDTTSTRNLVENKEDQIDPDQKKEEKARSKKVDKEIEEAKDKDEKELKLLLLGAGGSGKSTLFKQLETIHGRGFDEQDRKKIKSEMHEQVLDSMKLMIERLQGWIEEETEPNAKELYSISDSLTESVNYLNSLSTNAKISQECVKHILLLWKDSAIQRCYEKRNLTCIPDSTGIFINKLSEITNESYIPTQDDLLLVRTRTAGMNDKLYKIDKHTFKICDVGGQRNERRKWIHFFDNVTAVIFVASLSCYNEAIFEDETANAMEESMEVFHEHCNSKYFLDTAFILFLNKSDLFAEKIKNVSIKCCDKLKDYNGKQDDFDAASGFIKEKFLDLNENKDDREIYSHITNATNKDNIKSVFDDTQHIVVEFSLQKSGLL